MAIVLNVHRDAYRPETVYIGRGSDSVWGNPFLIGRDGTRQEVIEKYRVWLLSQPQLVEQVKFLLKGKNLMCFCAPLPCHGDILLEIANAT